MKQLPILIERCGDCPFCKRERDGDLLCSHPQYQFLFRPKVSSRGLHQSCPLPDGQPPELPEVQP